jgi:CRISPR-associated exonuclease Cas4
VEKFGYCPLTWWLSRNLAPEEGEGLAAGETKHEAIAEDLKGIEVHETRAREAEVGVMYFAIAATLVATVGLTFLGEGLRISELVSAIALIWLLTAVYFLYRADRIATPVERLLAERVILISAMTAAVIAIAAVSFRGVQNENLASGFEALALGWLIGASVFLYGSLRSTQIASATRQRHRIAGQLAYVDSARERPKVFVSERHGLSGRPDHVVVEGDHHIPVEVKTGRVPRGPLFSHILQVAAYCLLMEEEYGRAPPYGILRYGDVSHEIEYNDDLKRLLLTKLAEMRAAAAKGEAHRNHNRPGKCIGCSRRAACPERLA